MSGARRGRRSLLGALATTLPLLGTALLLGCGAEATTAPPKPPTLPPLRTGDLGALLPSAGLVWALRARPREIAQVAWLIPAIAAFAPEARLDRYAQLSGYDLRQAPEAWFAGYALGGPRGASDVQLVRHNASAREVERHFRVRLSRGGQRSSDRPDRVRISGRIGDEVHAFAALGADVVVEQTGGDPARGPTRIVAERAGGGLAELSGVTDSAPLAALLERFGGAPLVALAQGPFELEGAGPSALRGAAARLLSVASAAGVALRPTSREGLGVAIAIHADFGDRAAEASDVLATAWTDLAESELGRMLALDRAREPAQLSHAADAVALHVELPPADVARGLHALLEQDLPTLLDGPR